MFAVAHLARAIASLGAAALLAGCAQTGPSPNGWQDLLAADAPPWRAFGGDGPAPGWERADGVLTLTAPGAGDLTNGVIYADFELAFEWKVSPGGNSGVFYFVDADRENIPPYHTGPEYQVLDNARHADGRSDLTSAGAVYGLYSTDPAAARPAGEWNTGRIVARDGAVEHWLNGARVASYDIMSGAFRARVDDTKFAAWRKTFARGSRGLVVLQDHGDGVSYRNLRVRLLD